MSNKIEVQKQPISETELKSILAEILSVDDEDLSTDTRLSDLGADYLYLSEVIMAAEDAMGWWPLPDGVELEERGVDMTFGEFLNAMNEAYLA